MLLFSLQLLCQAAPREGVGYALVLKPLPSTTAKPVSSLPVSGYEARGAARQEEDIPRLPEDQNSRDKYGYYAGENDCDKKQVVSGAVVAQDSRIVVSLYALVFVHL